MKLFIPRVDGLESRDLKTITVVDSTILLEGAPPPNVRPPGESVVSVEYSASTNLVSVDWNGTIATFDRDQVIAIDFEGNPEDTFDYFVNATDLSAKARGGNGLNIFNATGGGASTFYGGDGWNQFIDYADGVYDAFVGGNGANVFFLGTHTNVMIGGTGFNFFVYGGDDNIIGIVDEGDNTLIHY